MTSLSRQTGATLLVVLVMLVMITLFVVSMVRLSSTNLKVVGNMQTQRQLEASAQQAIEERISTIAFFNDAANNTGTWPAGTNTVTSSVNSFTVTINRPTCVYSQVAEGYSATSQISPEDNNWEVRVASTDPLTGASIELMQGLKMRQTADNCPL
ncbi:MAG: hypothetical protein HYY28_15570 [Betaproteobacteria bacterium]|nr:hypothetical protein [Betaproteobacteria bacterium]